MSKDASNTNKSIILNSSARQRDRKAVASLHSEYFSRIKHHITSSIGSIAEAENLAQDVFVEFYKGNGHFRENSNPEKYLFGIANNIVRGYCRKRERSVKTISIEEIGTPTTIVDACQQPDPVNLTERQELIRIIEEALAKLPPKAKEAIKLRFIDGLSIGQSAQEAGCTPAIFSARLYYAIKVLRKVLGRLGKLYMGEE